MSERTKQESKSSTESYLKMTIEALNAEYDLFLKFTAPIEEIQNDSWHALDEKKNALVKFIDIIHLEDFGQFDLIRKQLRDYSKRQKGEVDLYVVFLGENQVIEKQFAKKVDGSVGQYQMTYITQDRMGRLMQKHGITAIPQQESKESSSLSAPPPPPGFSTKDVKKASNKSKSKRETKKQEQPKNTIESIDQRVISFIAEKQKKNTSFYLAGSSWGKEFRDQIDRFIEEGVWENGYDDKYTDAVIGVKVNDYIFIKSTFARPGESVMRIKAIGRVTQNPDDGKRVLVHWFTHGHKIDINGLGYYRDTIQKPSEDDLPKIIQAVFNENIVFPEIPIEEAFQSRDKMPFHLDNVEVNDKLNREPVAKSLARLINREIFDNNTLKHAFMIHLQGEWGSGKSTFLNLLQSNLAIDHKWTVIKFNAWQNQHLSPPWWSFIDQVYQGGIKNLGNIERQWIKFKETLRRIMWYSSWHKIFALIMTLVLLLVIIFNHKAILETLSNILKTEGSTFDTNDFIKLFLSLGSVIGLIYSLFRFITTPLLLKSSDQAKSFVTRASNPMERIQKHFNGLIDNFNTAGYNVAVFIDDIDRCNREYTVQLLEGIQTLFKDTKVLYVVAGDKKWITTCFKNNYAEFAENNSENGQHLGELFLEKAFQLSVRMPNVSEDAKERYWKYILGIKEEDITGETLKGEVDFKQKTIIKEQILDSYGQAKKNTDWLREIREEHSISEAAVTDIAIEALDENTTDVKHLFLSFYAYIKPNPRSIKRLANNYTMTRNTLIAERVDFEPATLFRWILLEDHHPGLIFELQKQQNMEAVDTYIEENQINEAEEDIIQTIINGITPDDEGLTISELRYIVGD